MDFPGNSDGKEHASNAGDPGLIPSPREWQPTPVFLPGEVHGQRSLQSMGVEKTQTRLND